MSKSIISIIDKHFDNRETPFDIEENATLFSFFKKLYSLLKSGSIDEELKNKYKSCAQEVIDAILYIESSKIYKYKFSNNDKVLNDFLKFVNTLKNKYTNRSFGELLPEEQKYNYENNYDEIIYIGNNLVPSFDEEKQEMSFTSSSGVIRISNKEITYDNNIYYSFDDFKKSFTSNSITKYCTTIGGTYYTSFAFSNGLVINGKNEYEWDNGVLFELFQSIIKTFSNSDGTNYLDEYLKRYYYTVLLEKYRTKESEDKVTDVKILNLSDRYMPVLPKVYETLRGKAGKIGSSNTIDFDINNDSYIKYPFYKSVLNTNGVIDFYINKKYLSGTLNLYKKYNTIDFNKSNNVKSFLYSRYTKSKLENEDLANNIIDNADEIKEEILKQNFFAIKPKFTPALDYYFSSFYFDNVEKLQKEFFYNATYKKSIIDLSFSNADMILSIKTNIIPETNIDFGKGVLNTRKIQQKFYDNIVSNIISSETTSKNSNFDSNEFSSVMDDREVTVVSKTDTIISPTNFGVGNVRKDGNNFVLSEFPEYKNATIFKKDDEIVLDCSEFAKYNDIGSINQIRIVTLDKNTNRYLFNVKRVETEYIDKDINYLELSATLPSELNISYVEGNSLYLSNYAYNAETSTEENSINIVSSDEDPIDIKENDNYASLNLNATIDTDDNYIYDDEIIFKDANFSNIEGDDYILIVSGEVKTKKEYKVKKYLILSENIYTNNNLTLTTTPKECQILDFVATKGNPKKFELGQFVYTSETSDEYKLYDSTSARKSLRIFFPKIKLYITKNSLEKSVNENLTLRCEEDISTYKIEVSNLLSKYYLKGLYCVNDILNNIKVNLGTNFDIIFVKANKFDVSPKKINISVYNKGMLFDGESYYSDKGRVSEFTRSDITSILDCIKPYIDNINFETNMDSKDDKILILLRNNNGSTYILNSETIDKKDIKGLTIDSNTLNIENTDKEMYLYKAEGEASMSEANKFNITLVDDDADDNILSVIPPSVNIDFEASMIINNES